MNNDKTNCGPKCDPCERMFEENIHHLVDEARPPRGAEHDAREKELEAAFGREKHNTPAGSRDYPLGREPEMTKE